MRGMRMERRLVEYLRMKGAKVYFSEALDHQKIDFVFAGLQGNGDNCTNHSQEIAVQLTTAPTDLRKFEKFIAVSGSANFPFKKKLYIAMPPRGITGEKILAIIFSILVSIQYNREDEASSKDRVACLIFGDCTYALTSAEKYKELVYQEYNLVDGVDTRNFIPVGTILQGNVFATVSQLEKGFLFVNAGGHRFFVHKSDQNRGIWDVVHLKVSLGEDITVKFVITDYAPRQGEGQRAYIQEIT